MFAMTELATPTAIRKVGVKALMKVKFSRNRVEQRENSRPYAEMHRDFLFIIESIVTYLKSKPTKLHIS